MRKLPKVYKVVNVYFDETDEGQLEVFDKLRKLEFQDKIESKSKFLRELATKAVKNK